MSVDNGIYILQTEGPEFRVQHCMAIDNINWDDVNKTYTSDEDICIKNAREIFVNAPLFTDENEAVLFAHKCSKEYEILEYGVQPIKINRKF